MKRWMLPLLVMLSWLFLLGAAYYQTPGSSGSPPQTALFNDANFTARMLPFIIALGIIVGVYEARKVFRDGSDQVLNESVRRHDSSVIIIHWMNAFGLITGLVSGATIRASTWNSVQPSTRALSISSRGIASKWTARRRRPVNESI